MTNTSGPLPSASASSSIFSYVATDAIFLYSTSIPVCSVNAFTTGSMIELSCHSPHTTIFASILSSPVPGRLHPRPVSAKTEKIISRRRGKRDFVFSCVMLFLLERDRSGMGLVQIPFLVKILLFLLCFVCPLWICALLVGDQMALHSYSILLLLFSHCL